MTDTPFPNLPEDTDADLLASLYVDGEATPTERTRVESDPDLIARVEQMRAVSAIVSEPVVGPSAAVRSGHMEAAMAAFDALQSGDQRPATVTSTAAAEAASGVSSLGAARERKQRQLPSWLGAAAVATLVVGGLGLLAANNVTSSDETASVAGDSADTSDESAETTAAASRASAGDDAESAELFMETEEEAMEQDDAMEEAEADFDSDASSADDGAAGDTAMEDTAVAAPTTTTTPPAADETSNDEPTVGQPRTPIEFRVDEGELLDDAYARLLPELFEPSEARCVAEPVISEFAAPDQILGFVFVITQSGIGELFVVDSPAGPDAVLVDQDCVLLQD